MNPRATTPFDEEVDYDAECQDGGYGWVCVACCFAVNALSWGVIAVSAPISIVVIQM